jgi:prepilin-type N-terminal cleavage/methylation domain-containing protein
MGRRPTSGPRPRVTRGFSLLEVMIALAIFSVGCLGLVPLFATASGGTRGGKEVTMAKELAQTYVEKLRNVPFANVRNCAGGCVPADAGEVAANQPFGVSWTVTAVDGTAYPGAAPWPDPNIKRVTVTVTCATCFRPNLRVRVQTLIAEKT